MLKTAFLNKVYIYIYTPREIEMYYLYIACHVFVFMRSFSLTHSAFLIHAFILSHTQANINKIDEQLLQKYMAHDAAGGFDGHILSWAKKQI